MLLAIDIGNSNISCGLFQADRLKRQWNFPAAQLNRKSFQKISYDAVVMASVVPKVTKIIKNNLKVPILNVTADLDLGIKIKYQKPRQIGADRIANVVAANNFYGTPALIVDFGTATTIDVLSLSGEYLGGLIMPGVDIARNALSEKTALLPLVSLRKPKKVLGKNTVEAIQSGIYYGFQGMIEHTLANLKKELRFSKKTVIISTGGYAKLMEKDINCVVDQALTLNGLRLIYEKNNK